MRYAFRSFLSDWEFQASLRIGTPHYMAPEVMRGHGYGTEVPGCVLERETVGRPKVNWTSTQRGFSLKIDGFLWVKLMVFYGLNMVFYGLNMVFYGLN